METAFVEEKEEWVGHPMLAVFLKSALKIDKITHYFYIFMQNIVIFYINII